MATRCRPGSIARRTPGSSAAWLARHVRDVEAGSSNLPSPTARRPPIPVAVRREGGTDGASMREGDAGRARDPHRASSTGARPDPRHPGRGLAEQPAPAPPGDDRRLDHAGVHERGDLPHRPLVAGDRRRRAGVHAVPLPHLRATGRSGRHPARPGAAGPVHRPHGGPDPQLERGARDRPAAPQLHGQDRGLLGAGAGQQGAAHRPGLPQPGRLRLGPARRARPGRRPAPGPHRRPSAARQRHRPDRRERQRPGRPRGRAAGAGGRRDGPHGPRGRGVPRRGGRQRSARDRDPGRHARRQQRARRGGPPGRLLELGRLPGPDRRRTARGGGLVHRVPALALRGRVGRAGRRRSAPSGPAT